MGNGPKKNLLHFAADPDKGMVLGMFITLLNIVKCSFLQCRFYVFEKMHEKTKQRILGLWYL